MNNPYLYRRSPISVKTGEAIMEHEDTVRNNLRRSSRSRLNYRRLRAISFEFV